MNKFSSLKDLPTRLLVESLTEGWTPTHFGAAIEFLGRWAAALNGTCEVRRVGHDGLFFRLNLGDISLRAMSSKPCLLLAGAEEASWAEELRKLTPSRHIPFVFALSDAAYERAAATLRGDLFLLLSKEDVLEILDGPDDPLTALKSTLLRRVPRRALIPYDILTPAEGSMFFGRSHELDRLNREDFVSFAIVGPGRIGKTSLLLQYKTLRLRQGASGRLPMFFISFYGCEADGDAAARFMAMDIDSSRRSSRVTADGLPDFLKYHARHHGCPLELLLDEVDVVCHTSAFEALGAAARMGYCRLILSGRGSLLKMMLSSHSLLGARLDLIRLHPLEDDSALTLLLKPLRDLGFDIHAPEVLAEEVLSLTGRLPHLLQFVCRQLADLALHEQAEVISARHLEQLKGDFLIAQYFLMPLQQLEDPLSRLVALLMLASGRRTFGLQEVREEAAHVGLDLDQRAAVDVCNELVINNVLSWDRGGYGVASAGLYHYAHETGYLDSALAETLSEVKARRR